MSNLRDKTSTNTQDEFIEHTPLMSLTLTVFQPVTTYYVEKLLAETANKMCHLDPIPTKIVKAISGSILPLLKDNINMSLILTTFISDLKQALLKPLLQKADLPLIVKNYWPVSNLSYVSKLIEHVGCGQLTECTVKTGNIKTDILQLFDRKEVTCFILLDVSAGFDTVDHKLLLHGLEHRFDIKDTELNWMRDYLTDWTEHAVQHQW